MRMFAIARRIILQIGKDPRTMALLFFAPVFALYLFQVIFTSGVSMPRVGLVDVPELWRDRFAVEMDIAEYAAEAEAREAVIAGDRDAYIVWGGEIRVVLEGADASLAGLVMMKLQKSMMEGLRQALSRLPSRSPLSMPTFAAEYIYGSEDRQEFEYVSPLVMGFFIFFFVFLIAGIAFLRERISGTLERILATSLQRREIVGGYFAGFGLFVIIQTLVIQIFMTWVLGMPNAGSFVAVLLLNLLLAANSLALGMLLSAFARNEFQLIQFVPIVIVPQIVFSGLFPLRDAPAWVQFLSTIFPLTYAADALRDIMIRGATLWDERWNVLVLLGFTALFLVLNSLALKKYRKA